jgi:hypothetical protein
LMFLGCVIMNALCRYVMAADNSGARNNLIENRKERCHLEHLGSSRRTFLRACVKDVRLFTGIIWTRVWTGGELFWTSQWSVWSYKRPVNFD